MVVSHYFVLVFLVQLVARILLLVNRFVPLALVLLAPRACKRPALLVENFGQSATAELRP